jgi:hypothetical protein
VDERVLARVSNMGVPPQLEVRERVESTHPHRARRRRKTILNTPPDGAIQSYAGWPTPASAGIVLPEGRIMLRNHGRAAPQE